MWLFRKLELRLGEHIVPYMHCQKATGGIHLAVIEIAKRVKVESSVASASVIPVAFGAYRIRYGSVKIRVCFSSSCFG
jgi:hypothetical protein